MNHGQAATANEAVLSANYSIHRKSKNIFFCKTIPLNQEGDDRKFKGGTNIFMSRTFEREKKQNIYINYTSSFFVERVQD